VVGYQFVGPLPLGKISIESASLHFYSALQAKLLEHGLLLSTTSSRSAPRITFKTISLNAYDLLITRRVVCQAETLVSLNNQEDTLQIELSSYHNLPFERELSTHLRICLKELAREVIKKIVIYPFQMKKS
jgi:hypothetical protein